MTEYLRKLQQGSVLSESEMSEAIELIMDGAASESQIGAFLMGLSQRGETAAEISGAAKVMTQMAVKIKAPKNAVDCCGTGGDGANTYNISTAVALVAAACGVPVAKHGNRAASSKSGTADVLECLGVNLNVPLDQLEKALMKYNFCFLMAPRHHKALKHVVPVRSQLGFRTIFNILGPLANPACTKKQLIGTFDKKWLVPMAEALGKMGSTDAWIVNGRDGLDEITLTGETDIAVLKKGKVTQQTLGPEDFGFSSVNTEDLRGGSAEENAEALKEVLSGMDSAYRRVVIANTSAVLMIHGSEKSLRNGCARAAKAIDKGLAMEVLINYINFSRQFQ